MWEKLTHQWQKCLDLAWESYREGSIPIAAVVCDKRGNIITQGRNRSRGLRKTDDQQIVGGRLAHAEINALLGLDELKVDRHELELYTTVEPCPLCIGAICMANVKIVRYAARDAWSGSTNLLDDSPYMQWKAIKAISPEDPLLERFIHIFQVTGQLEQNHPRVKEVLARWESVYPVNVQLGRRVQEAEILKRLANSDAEIQQVVEQVLAFIEKEATFR